MRQISRKATTYALAATTVLAGATVASAAGLDSLRSPTTSAQSASGDLSTPGVLTHIVFKAHRAKGADETQATGHFTGRLAVAGSKVLEFGGPITCLYVKGNSVGFFYPVTESDPAFVRSLGAGVFIYVDTDGRGHGTAMNFLPVPAGTTAGCYPLPGLAPVTGRAAVKGG